MGKGEAQGREGALCPEASPGGQLQLLCLEISNLLIMRGSSAHARPLNLSQLSFHRVHQDDITQVGALGQGIRIWGWGFACCPVPFTLHSVPFLNSCPTWAKAQGPMCMRACYEWGALMKAKWTVAAPLSLVGTVGSSSGWCLKSWTLATMASPW